MLQARPSMGLVASGAARRKLHGIRHGALNLVPLWKEPRHQATTRLPSTSVREHNISTTAPSGGIDEACAETGRQETIRCARPAANDSVAGEGWRIKERSAGSAKPQSRGSKRGPRDPRTLSGGLVRTGTTEFQDLAWGTSMASASARAKIGEPLDARCNQRCDCTWREEHPPSRVHKRLSELPVCPFLRSTVQCAGTCTVLRRQQLRLFLRGSMLSLRKKKKAVQSFHMRVLNCRLSTQDQTRKVRAGIRPRPRWVFMDTFVS